MSRSALTKEEEAEDGEEPSEDGRYDSDDGMRIDQLPHNESHPHQHLQVELDVEEHRGTKVYSIRWLMLGLFCFLTLSNGMVWATPQPVTESFRQWFGVSSFAVNWLSMIFMATYCVGLFPAAFISGNLGTRIPVLIGTALTVLGAAIRALPFGGFTVVFIGQFLTAVGQLFTLGAPPQIAAIWFPPEQRGLATAIGAVANMAGPAVSFLIGPALADDILLLLVINSIICSVMGILLVIFFRESPPLPPSLVQSDDSFSLSDLRGLFKNLQFLIFAIGSGMAIGSYWAVPTLLSQSIVPHGYSEADAGRLGFVLIAVGIVGSIVAGFILDRLSAWQKSLIVGSALIGTIALIGYFFSMIPDRIVFLYLSVGVYGFFFSALIPLSMEAVAECAFPISETVTGGVVMLFANIFSLGLTFAMSVLQDPVTGSTSISNTVAGAVVIVGVILMAVWRFERKRSLAETSATPSFRTVDEVHQQSVRADLDSQLPVTYGSEQPQLPG